MDQVACLWSEKVKLQQKMFDGREVLLVDDVSLHDGLFYAICFRKKNEDTVVRADLHPCEQLSSLNGHEGRWKQELSRR